MKPERALLRALHRIADREAVDWTSLDGSTAGAPGVAELRAIAALADLHRTKALEWTAEHESPSRGARVIGVIDPERRAAVRRPPAADDGERWGNLVLRERLGGGAFGDVYAAYDPVLDHEVALKLLRRDVGSRGTRERVFSEARALAQVTHEHVVRVHGAEEHDGRIGIRMERVHGRTLEQALAERGPLNAREAAIAGQDLCRALAAVHRCGLVHGDVKCQNVMREDGGRLVLMDFGAHRGRPETEDLPASGTPLYLAPEVLNGAAPRVTSDIYALGVLLFRMVTGAYPVMARSQDELVRAHRLGHARRLHDLRPDLPPSFVRVIEKALATDAATRYSTAGEMEAALGAVLGQQAAPQVPSIAASRALTGSRWWRPAAAFVLAIVVVAAALAWWWRAPRSSAGEGAVAVLPFRNLGADPQLEYIASGLSDYLTGRISALPGIVVKAGPSLRRFNGDAISAASIGTELGVSRVLAGSVLVSDEVIRLNVQLYDCASSEVVWARSFDASRADLLRVQSDVATELGTALKGRLSSTELHSLTQRPDTLETYNLYLQGRFHVARRTPESIRRGIDYLKASIAREPTFALGYAGLAEAYALWPAYERIDPRNARLDTERAANEAMRLDPTLARAILALALVRHAEFRWADAEALYRRAIAAEPNLVAAHHNYAMMLAQRGRFDEANARIGEAQRLDPLSVPVSTAAAEIMYLSGALTQAARQFQHVLAMDPAFSLAHQALAQVHTDQGNYADAERALVEAERNPVEEPWVAVSRAYIAALQGRTAVARQAVTDLEARPANVRPSLVDLAAVRLVLGSADDAMALLGRAVADEDVLVPYLGVDRRFEALRKDRRYLELLRMVGFTPTEGVQHP